MNSDNANITGYALDIEFKGICDYADSSDDLTSMEDSFLRSIHCVC